MSLDPILEAWGRQNPWEMTLPSGAPNPFFDANPRHQTPKPATPNIAIPDFSKRQNSATGPVEIDPNRDPNPKRHGSLPVAIPPRTLHVA
jgi:hypothetical protein